MISRAGRRLLTVIAAVAVCADALASCSVGADVNGSTQNTAAPRAGGRLVYGIEADPNGLDPTRNGWDPSGHQLAYALYDPLAAFDADGVARPYLAQSFTPSADYTSWLIRLRPGVRFSNGDPLDADATVGFLDGLRSSPITGPLLRIISDVRAVDPMTVQITASRPWATLPVQMTGQGGFVVSPKQIKDPEGTSKPIGTGPFLLSTWEVDKRFELIKNPSYWRRGLPLLDAVEFIVEPEGVQRVQMLKTGAIDVTTLSQLWDLKALDDAVASAPPSTLSVEMEPGDADVTTIMFNTTKAPFDDLRIRRAVAAATDIPTLAAKSSWPLDSLAQGPIDPTSRFFAPAPYPPHDVAVAQSLISAYQADARVPNRPQEITFTLLAPDSGAEFVNELTAQWARAGIKASVSFSDQKNLVRLAVLGQFDAMVWRNFAVPDPDLLWHFFVDDSIDPSGISINFPRLRSPEITAAMNDGRATADVDARRRAYARVQEAFAVQLPYIWLQRSPARVAMTSRVHDARNLTLPDGSPALPLLSGTHRLTETWVEH